jgi:hypothetical protein
LLRYSTDSEKRVGKLSAIHMDVFESLVYLEGVYTPIELVCSAEWCPCVRLWIWLWVARVVAYRQYFGKCSQRQTNNLEQNGDFELFDPMGTWDRGMGEVSPDQSVRDCADNVIVQWNKGTGVLCE